MVSWLGFLSPITAAAEAAMGDASSLAALSPGVAIINGIAKPSNATNNSHKPVDDNNSGGSNISFISPELGNIIDDVKPSFDIMTYIPWIIIGIVGLLLVSMIFKGG